VLVYNNSKGHRSILLFAGHTVSDQQTTKGGLLYMTSNQEHISWWFIVYDLTYYLQIKEDYLLEFSPFLGFSKVNSCACVRFYLSTSSTTVHHFKCPFFLVERSSFCLKWKKNKRMVKHFDIIYIYIYIYKSLKN
jgi:hypothetical protein